MQKAAVGETKHSTIVCSHQVVVRQCKLGSRSCLTNVELVLLPSEEFACDVAGGLGEILAAQFVAVSLAVGYRLPAYGMQSLCESQL